MTAVMSFLLGIFVGVISFASAFSLKSPVDQIRNAMSLTNIGQTNITAATSAVNAWEGILYDPSEFNIKDQPLPIRILCNSLYASSLARIGRDRDALLVHEKSLLWIDQEDTQQIQIEGDVLLNIRIGRGEALQRLLQYDKAQAEFIAACELGSKYPMLSLPEMDGKLDKCAYSAAVCAMRQGDWETAISILQPIFGVGKGTSTSLTDIDPDLVGMYGVLLWDGPDDETKLQRSSMPSPMQLLKYAASSSVASPVYKWFYAFASNSSCDFFQEDLADMDREDFLRIVSINQSPFDDMKLFHLDDKVLLHDLLQNVETRTSCWPVGFVLPRDRDDLEKYNLANKNARWIMKDRAGYGSHGNQILACDNNFEQYLDRKFRVDPKCSVLCQKLIEPSLLYDGRKFSIRVYVVYFQDGEVGGKGGDLYLLNEGLAKLAESEFDANGSNDGMYMTNSGRIEGDAMIQFNFDSLKVYIEGTHGKGAFDKTWSAVEESVIEVMRALAKQKVSRIGTRRTRPNMYSTVPKIMGLDYIIDKALKPWLMEVNRFPGLEARGAIDYKVKNKVVSSAWKLASIRSGVACGLADVKVGNVKKLSTD